MDFVNVSLSAIGLLLGFSLSSLITVLIEWLKKKTDDASIETPKINSISQTNDQIRSAEDRKAPVGQFTRLRVFNLLSTKYSEFFLDNIINILKIISCIFVIVFWTLLLGYVRESEGIIISNIFLRISLLLTYYVFPIIGLELVLLLLFNIRMSQKALFTKTSHIIAIVSMAWVILVFIVTMLPL